jgi:hypothetical protein
VALGDAPGFATCGEKVRLVGENVAMAKWIGGGQAGATLNTAKPRVNKLFRINICVFSCLLRTMQLDPCLTRRDHACLLKNENHLHFRIYGNRAATHGEYEKSLRHSD